MRIAVTGAAGYVAGAIIDQLHARGDHLLLIDTTAPSPNITTLADLAVPVGPTGPARAAAGAGPAAITYHQAAISDPTTAQALARFEPDACVHLAASIDIEASKRYPLYYWSNNVAETITLLHFLEAAGCRRLVFASTAAVYAAHPDPTHRLSERDRLAPANPYGASKLACEQLLHDVTTHLRFRVGIMRFFNAAGALTQHPTDHSNRRSDAPIGGHGENHDPETHLIPRVITAAISGEPVHLYGTDFTTPDGTALRDYVHIQDIAAACLLLLDHLQTGASLTINIGSGTGASVRDVITAVERLTSSTLEVHPEPARPGEPPQLVADITLARDVLDWSPAHHLDDILTDALNWHTHQHQTRHNTHDPDPVLTKSVAVAGRCVPGAQQ